MKKPKNSTIFCLQEISLKYEHTDRMKIKDGKTYYMYTVIKRKLISYSIIR